MTSVLHVRLELSKDGLLKRFDAQGHAGDDLGKNVACAAATVLLRTAGRECAARGIVARGNAARPGEMAMVLKDRGEDRGEWLRGVTDFLVRGMSDLEREFPDRVVLCVETTED